MSYASRRRARSPGPGYRPFLAGLFLLLGSAKLMLPFMFPMPPGYPPWVLPVVMAFGLAEVVAAVAVFVPRYAAWVAAGLAVLVAGLSATALLVPNAPPAWPTLLVVSAVAAVGYGFAREQREREQLAAAMARYATLHPEPDARRGQ